MPGTPTGPAAKRSRYSSVEIAGASTAAADDAPTVLDVRIVGNQAIKAERIRRHIRTRRDRPLTTETVEEDVRRLNATRYFLDVKPLYQEVPGGVVVIFEVVERPTLTDVIYVGNTTAKDKVLAKETGLKAGGAVDPYSIEDGRRKIEQFYQERGFRQVRVEIEEGNEPGDRRAIFVIHEGPKQKIRDVEFVGNQIASSARLQTLIKSKRPWFAVPPIFGGYKGFVEEEKIEEDLVTLYSYYRSLGFFQADIGREVQYSDDQRWATLRFVIDEGVRYRVQNVTFIGNEKFATEELDALVELKAGEYFDQAKMDKDLDNLVLEYGSIGHVFADIQADPRFQAEPGSLDLVYSISEGARARVGRVNVHVEGDHPHTKRTAILNQVSLQPGDILDIRKLRDSERRLRASGLFATNPMQGEPPRIVYSAPEVDETEGLAERPQRNYRGQSPDPEPYRAQRPAPPTSGEVLLDVNVFETPAAPQPGSPPPTASFQPVAVVPTSPIYPAAPPRTATPPRRSPFPPHLALPPDRATTPAKSEPELVIRGQSPGYHRWGDPPAATIDAGNSSAQSRTSRREPMPSTAPLWTNQRSIEEPTVVRGQYSPFNGETLPPLTPQRPPAYSYQPPTAQPQPVQSAPPAYQQPGYGTTPNPQPVYQAPANQTPAYGGVVGQQPGAAYQAPPAYQSGPVYTAPPQAASQPGVSGDGPPAYLNFGDARAEVAPGAAPSGVPPGTSSGLGGYDSPGELFPEGGYPFLDPEGEPALEVPLDIHVEETQTGRLMFGVGINSDAGLVGSIVLDEQNFDWRRVPTSFEDIRNATAFRGAGQQLRIEAVPGTQVQRYMINFREPYLMDTPISFGISAFLFDRQYFDWDEQRLGGRLTFGYQFTPDLSGTIALRGERVNIRNPLLPAPTELLDVLGDNELWSARTALAHDTRDSVFLPTEGHRIELGFEQVFGQFDYPRGTLDASQYFLLHERPDRSGRHTLSFATQLGISGSQTPIFENFFAGGFSTMRGFRFRGASPRDMNVTVGGRLQWLNTVEYMFPMTADDMLRGVMFCDFGTVEREIELTGDDFRVAPGFGLRITVPAMGPAPIALDLAFPIARAEGDRIQNFSFFVGFGR